MKGCEWNTITKVHQYQTSAGKVMLTAFTDVNGVGHLELMPTGATIDYEC